MVRIGGPALRWEVESAAALPGSGDAVKIQCAAPGAEVLTTTSSRRPSPSGENGEPASETGPSAGGTVSSVTPKVAIWAGLIGRADGAAYAVGPLGPTSW